MVWLDMGVTGKSVSSDEISLKTALEIKIPLLGEERHRLHVAIYVQGNEYRL